MTLATDLLNRVAEVGATIEAAAGDRLVVRAGANPVPGELARRLREAKTEVLAALRPAVHEPVAADASWWRRQLVIRTIDRALGSTRSHEEAVRLAWSELECRWHSLHRIQVPEWECAGCGKLIGGLPALHLSDGNRVHDNLDCDCLIRYGARWRGVARLALTAMGLQPPPEKDATVKAGDPAT